jgi:hypothetical protein
MASQRYLRMSRLTQEGVVGSDNIEEEQAPYHDASMG